jgi:hypothetical protein
VKNTYVKKVEKLRKLAYSRRVAENYIIGEKYERQELLGKHNDDLDGNFERNPALQMKGRQESNINVWFPFMYSQK